MILCSIGRNCIGEKDRESNRGKFSEWNTGRGKNCIKSAVCAEEEKEEVADTDSSILGSGIGWNCCVDVVYEKDG